MLYYLVVGLCLALLIAVIYFSIKPISMGIEARRNINDKSSNEILNEDGINENISKLDTEQKIKISDEIIKLNKLKNEGLLSEEEFEKAKQKLIN